MNRAMRVYRREAIVQWIITYAIAHGGNSPTVEEIANHFGKYKATIQSQLEELYALGIAERKDGKLVVHGVTIVPPEWYIAELVEQTSD